MNKVYIIAMVTLLIYCYSSSINMIINTFYTVHNEL